MTPLSTVIGQVVALLGYFALVLAAPRVPALQRWRAWLAGCLAVLALAAYVDFGRLHPVRIWVHYWDTYHYLIPAKYFAELGYDGLYEATVIADAQDDPPSLVPQIPIRSLTTYEMETRGAIAARAAQVQARFTPARWSEFKSDVAYFRAVDPLQWRNSQVLVDHGYNGTPVVTAVLGAIANHSGLSTGALVWALSFSDLAVLLVLGLVVMWRIGVEEAALVVLVWAANPLNDYQVIGGAPIRSLHVLLLVAGALALRHGRLRLSGAGVGIASGLRVLPGAIVAMTLAWAWLGRDRSGREQRIAAWVIASLVAGALVVGAGARQEAPDGRMGWLPFAEKITLHGNKLSPNVVTLRYPFLYSEAHNAAVVEASWPDGERLNWVTESTRTLASRWRAYQATLCVFALGFALLLRRGRVQDAWLAGIFVPFAALAPSHYEQAVLCVLPVLFAGNRAMLLTCLAGLASVGLVRLVPGVDAVIDRRFLVMSLAVATMFAALLAVRLWQMRASDADRAPSGPT